jgi:Transposase domain (DUF772)
MTKSPLAVAREALVVGERTLPAQTNKFSRKDYTLAQLFALLVLRKFFRTDFRGVVTIVREWSELRDVLGLDKVPDHSTLWHVEQKLLKKGGLHNCWLLVASADAQMV